MYPIRHQQKKKKVKEREGRGGEGREVLFDYLKSPAEMEFSSDVLEFPNKHG